MKFFKVKEFGTSNGRVVILLGGWKMKMWMYWPIGNFLALFGFHTVAYTYADETLSPDIQKTKKRIFLIRNHVVSTIESLKNEGKKSFSLFGSSLGALITILVANKSQEVEHIVLSVPGDSLAESIWQWNERKPYFKQAFRKQGVTLKKLKNAWESLDPRNNMDNLCQTELLILLAGQDKIAQCNVRGMQSFLNNKNYQYRILINRSVGHILGLTLHLLHIYLFFDFFKGLSFKSVDRKPHALIGESFSL